MEINKYPDGTSYIKVTERNEDVIFKINLYEDLWHLNQYVDAHNSMYGLCPTIIIPNLLDAQADRRFNIEESSGLKLVLKFLNSMDADFKIFHPHNPEVVEALLDRVEIIDNSEFINKVIHKLAEVGMTSTAMGTDISDPLILMSSDAGGFKPLMKLCDKISWEGETYSASKSRKYIDGKTKLTQIVDREDFQGKDILIVDDISVYGGTFKGLSKLLRERNCGKLYLTVSHMTVQNLGKDPVTEYFDAVFCSNSKFNEYYSESSKLENLEIINLF